MSIYNLRSERSTNFDANRLIDNNSHIVDTFRLNIINYAIAVAAPRILQPRDLLKMNTMPIDDILLPFVINFLNNQYSQPSPAFTRTAAETTSTYFRDPVNDKS